VDSNTDPVSHTTTVEQVAGGYQVKIKFTTVPVASETYSITLSGTLTKTDGVGYNIDIGAGDWDITMASAGSYVFYEDFNDIALGEFTAATAASICTVASDTGAVIPAGFVYVTTDPAGNTGRGRVLEVRHREGTKSAYEGAGGMQFMWVLDTPQDECYFCYDTYVPFGGFWPWEGWKIPSVGDGTWPEATHPVASPPIYSGTKGTNARHEPLGWGGSTAWPENGGRIRSQLLEATQRLYYMWYQNLTPQTTDNQYWEPGGRWIRIEERIKMNTADADAAYNPANDLSDGIFEVWVQDDVLGPYAVPVIQSTGKLIRYTSNFKISRIQMIDFYGGESDLYVSDPSQQVNCSVPLMNKLPSWWPYLQGPDADGYRYQSRYYDNFIVSTSPILLRAP